MAHRRQKIIQVPAVWQVNGGMFKDDANGNGGYWWLMMVDGGSRWLMVVIMIQLFFSKDHGAEWGVMKGRHLWIS